MSGLQAFDAQDQDQAMATGEAEAEAYADAKAKDTAKAEVCLCMPFSLWHTYEYGAFARHPEDALEGL